MNETDRKHMARALTLAEQGRGAVEPNPMVGAVVANGDRILGEGWHARFGGPHAEPIALDQAGAAARGATLYVTLEPCSHFGKTPPCVDRVVASGVARVVVAMQDPFPAVAGRGLEKLRQAGIGVEVGLLESEARELNAPYLTLLSRDRPFVHAKWAMSVDGKIATSSGESKWITGELARSHGRQFRGLMDGILVGANTVSADDPLLTATAASPRVPTRVIIDSTLRTHDKCQLIKTVKEAPTLIATTTLAAKPRIDAFRSAGAEVLVLPSQDRRVSLTALLAELGRRRWTNLLVEGGAETLGSFFAIGAVDAARVYLAPKILGGRSAPSPVAGPGIAKLADAFQLALKEVETLGPDLFLRLVKAG